MEHVAFWEAILGVHPYYRSRITGDEVSECYTSLVGINRPSKLDPFPFDAQQHWVRRPACDCVLFSKEQKSEKVLHFNALFRRAS